MTKLSETQKFGTKQVHKRQISSGKRLVHTSDAKFAQAQVNIRLTNLNANANASTSADAKDEKFSISLRLPLRLWLYFKRVSRATKMHAQTQGNVMSKTTRSMPP